MHNILHVELGLVKNSARWVPKLLSSEQKEETVRICSEFIVSVDCSSMAMLDKIIMMDGVLSHSPDQKTVEAVDRKRKTRLYQGHSPCQLDKTDVAGLL
jgi:hypothetical protein